jgi:hypothetical protein
MNHRHIPIRLVLAALTTPSLVAFGRTSFADTASYEGRPVPNPQVSA